MSYGIKTNGDVRKLTENGDVLFEVKGVFGEYIGADESTVDELSLEHESVTDSMAETFVNNFDENNIVNSSETHNTVSFEVDLDKFDFNLIVTVSSEENQSI